MSLAFRNTSAIKNALQRINATNPNVTMMLPKTLFAIHQSPSLVMTKMTVLLILATFKKVVSTHLLLPINAKNALRTPIAHPTQSPTISIPTVLSHHAALKDNVFLNQQTARLAFLNKSANNLAQQPINANLMDALMMKTRKFFALMLLRPVTMENNVLKIIATLPLVCASMSKVQHAVLSAKQLLIALNGVLLTSLQTIANNHSVTKIKELVFLLMLQMLLNAPFPTVKMFAHQQNAKISLAHTITTKKSPALLRLLIAMTVTIAQ
jgi:hypothetical protein